MRNDGQDGKGTSVEEPGVSSDVGKQENSSREESSAGEPPRGVFEKDAPAAEVATINIVISCSDVCEQAPAVSDLKGNGSKNTDEKAEGVVAAGTPKKGFLSRSGSYNEECRQVAENVPNPGSQPSASYWIWRVDTPFGGSNNVQAERERGCFSPLWVAFSILIGGLLLDVLISISLGVSALPVNIIIGVLVVLGLGTALRLVLEYCHEWSLRRSVQRVDTNINSGYHPAV